MFFKPKDQSNDYTPAALKMTFTFWGIVLLVNAISEIYTSKPVISSSLIILISGLIVLFGTDLILKQLKRTKKP